jgi:hypothetical protein
MKQNNANRFAHGRALSTSVAVVSQSSAADIWACKIPKSGAVQVPAH